MIGLSDEESDLLEAAKALEAAVERWRRLVPNGVDKRHAAMRVRNAREDLHDQARRVLGIAPVEDVP